MCYERELNAIISTTSRNSDIVAQICSVEFEVQLSSFSVQHFSPRTHDTSSLSIIILIGDMTRPVQLSTLQGVKAEWQTMKQIKANITEEDKLTMYQLNRIAERVGLNDLDLSPFQRLRHCGLHTTN